MRSRPIIDDGGNEFIGLAAERVADAPTFLAHFGFNTLRDLPDTDALEDAGFLSKEQLLAGEIPLAIADEAEALAAVGHRLFGDLGRLLAGINVDERHA